MIVGNTPSTDKSADVGSNGTAAPHRLEPQHVADLEKSGLSAETIAAAGLASIEGARVLQVLKWKGGAQALGPCLHLPFFDLSGNRIAFGRLKPDRPRTRQTKDGSPRLVKCEQPKGQPLRAYFPPALGKLLNDPATPILFTEGEKKALKACQEGLACVGLTGVQAWSVPRAKGADNKPIGKRNLLPDLAALPLAKRE